MKHFLILVAIFATPTLSHPSEENEWAKFKRIHQKTYNGEDEPLRAKIFEDNLKKIEEHNKLYENNQVSYRMAVNKFTDMSREEFLAFFGGYEYHGDLKNSTIFKRPAKVEIPDEIDWREQGAVTEIKNQGTCGACWAFSTTGALEGQNFIKNGVLMSLSEQELVDCIIQRSVRGCHGGYTNVAYKYVLDKGLSKEIDYPYEEQDDNCHRGSLPSAVTEIRYVQIFGDEEVLREAVATVGPIAVAVNTPNWQFYSGGIYYDETCRSDPNSLNHAVLAVGYGADNGTDYWLVKNQYGPEWGEEGYIRLARNAGNNCGIATRPTYPVVQIEGEKFVN